MKILTVLLSDFCSISMTNERLLTFELIAS